MSKTAFTATAPNGQSFTRKSVREFAFAVVGRAGKRGVEIAESQVAFSKAAGNAEGVARWEARVEAARASVGDWECVAFSGNRRLAEGAATKFRCWNNHEEVAVVVATAEG